MQETPSTTSKLAHEIALANDSLPQLVRRFAIPNAISMLAAGLQAAIDGIMVGNFVGSNALASVTIVLPLYILVNSLSIIMGIGSQTLVNIAQGERNYQKASNAMTTGFAFMIFSCTLISILIISNCEAVATFLGGNEALNPYITQYIYGLFPFAPMIGGAFYNDFMLRSMGHPKRSMSILVLVLTLNCTLNFVFMGIFKLGIFGAALGTGIAWTTSIILSTYYLQFKEKDAKLLSGRIKPRMLWRMFYNGSSEGLTEFGGTLSIFLFNATFIKHMGEQGVAAYSIINNLYFLGMVTLLGISDGIIPIISYNFGAKQYERCKQAYKFAIKINLGIGLVFAFIFLAFGPFIINLFVRDGNEDVVNIAILGARIFAITFFINGFNILSTSFFTSIADAKRSIYISILRCIILISIFITYIPIIFGVRYVWFALPLAEFGAGIFAFIIIRKLFKRWGV